MSRDVLPAVRIANLPFASPFRLIVVALAIALVGVAACGEQSASTPSATTATAAAAAPAAAEPAPATTEAAPAAPAGDATQGRAVAQANGCLACHTLDGSTGIGPTWKGVFEHSVELADGSTVNADAAYLRESIVQPDAKVVKGFQPGVMPKTFASLSDADLSNLIALIASL